MGDVYHVEVTRTVVLAVTAGSKVEARDLGLDRAWEWQPEPADGEDQGYAGAIVVGKRPPQLRLAADGGRRV